MENRSDLELMKLVQSGENKYVGELYERHKKNLYSYFYRSTNDRMKSEDLVQNVFIKVIKYKDQFKGNGEFVYWLFRIGRNTLLDTYKKKDPIHLAAEINQDKMESFSMQAAHMVDRSDQVSKMKRALEVISSEKKDAILLSRYNGMDYKTIAEMSGCTENAIKSRVMRGIIEIKEIVKSMS